VKRELLGYVVGEATTTSATFISKTMPLIGQYVTVDYDGVDVLAIVKNLVRGNVSIPEEIHEPEIVERIRALDKGSSVYVKGYLKILGDVEHLTIPRVPPQPGSPVFKADEATLTRIFEDTGSGIRLGVLLTEPRTPVYVDVNKMVSRHLAILAVTGAGKSNAVAIIAERIVERGGCVVIFDMHSEYVSADFAVNVNKISTKLNPVNMRFSELLKLLNVEPRAYVQERYLREAVNSASRRVLSGEAPADRFINMIREHLQGMLESENSPRRDRDSILAVLNKIDEFEDKYSDIIDPYIPPIQRQIRPAAVNVMDLGLLDEDMADVAVSHAVRSILESRKKYCLTGGEKGISFPILLVLEEAHILAPRDRDTLSKYWISRVAREGRKFGTGLCLVSQRPKALDSNALSQANNMVILRLVEPTDQRYVQQASELLSDDLLEQLPSLNVGEAVVIGPMTRIPVLVKIDRFRGKRLGEDLNILEEWERLASKGGSEPLDLLERW